MISFVISAWSATWSVHDQSRGQCMISHGIRHDSQVTSAWSVRRSVHDQPRDPGMIDMWSVHESYVISAWSAITNPECFWLFQVTVYQCEEVGKLEACRDYCTQVLKTKFCPNSSYPSSHSSPPVLKAQRNHQKDKWHSFLHVNNNFESTIKGSPICIPFPLRDGRKLTLREGLFGTWILYNGGTGAWNDVLSSLTGSVIVLRMG